MAEELGWLAVVEVRMADLEGEEAAEAPIPEEEAVAEMKTSRWLSCDVVASGWKSEVSRKQRRRPPRTPAVVTGQTVSILDRTQALYCSDWVKSSAELYLG